MLELVVTALAAWRLAHMLVKEEGPWAIFARLRRAAGIEQIIVQGPNGTDIALSARTSLAEGLLCVWCVSVWTATFFLLTPFIPVAGIGFVWLGRILAVSAGAIIIQEGVTFVRGSE